MSHTPGPWAIKLNQGSINGASIYSGDFRVVTIPRKADRPYPQKEADAALIAAAPDLLAACQIAVDLIEDYVQGRPEVAAQMRAAIAKAEGRS